MMPFIPARGEDGLTYDVPSGNITPLGSYFRLDGRRRPYQVIIFRHNDSGKLFEMRPFRQHPRSHRRKGL